VLEPPDKESIVNVAYANSGRLLVAITASGTVWLWRHNGGPTSDGEDQWIQQLPVSIDASIESVLTGGANQGLVAVQTADGVEILREYIMKCAYGGRTSVLQTASNRAIVEHKLTTSQDLEVQCPFPLSPTHTSTPTPTTTTPTPTPTPYSCEAQFRYGSGSDDGPPCTRP
jgi:hypothetical protein